MAYLGKINPHYVIDAVKCTVVRFFRSDGLLTARDTKLERLKSAILFTIAYALCVKKQDMCMLSEEKKIKNRNFIHLLLSFTLAKLSFTLGQTIHRVKKHYRLLLPVKLRISVC